MISSATTRVRLDSLTGVRFFAAFLVFGFHSLHLSHEVELDIFGAGMVGVSLFYIISGFVMSWTARENDRPRLFYQRRIARIYPAFIVAWLISLTILLTSSGVTAWDALVPPTLLQVWFPVEGIYFAGSAVFWSLSCEAFFYLVFPLVQRLIVRLRTPQLWAVAVAAGGISLGTALAAIGAVESDFTRWILVMFPPLRLMEFVIGMVLGIAFRRGFRFPLPVWVAVVVAALGVVGAAYAPYSLSRFAVTLIPFVILVAALATADLTNSRSIFRWSPLVTLGVWSYCLYLLHTMVLSTVFRIARFLGVDAETASSLVVWGLLLAGLVASVVSAGLLHVLVEAPFEKRLRPGGSQPASRSRWGAPPFARPH